MASEKDEHKELLSSLVSDIKSYSGSDPLRPWIHGIKKMKSVLPPSALKEKLPRFLQKCAQTFESDQRYQNDARYLRVWIDLMDYVDDAKVLLRKMEKNQIGLKRASFYIAYAFYYEKHRKLEKAEQMYNIGAQNNAEPISDLQKYYKEFLHRVELYKKRKSKLQEKRSKESKPENINKGEGTSKNSKITKKPKKNTQLNRFNSENTIMVRKFVDFAIEEKSRAENILHLGLVEPTMHTKEAMSDIISMFQKPLDIDEDLGRKNNRRKMKNKEGGFEIFVDEENRVNKIENKNENEDGGFEIYIDEENRVRDENKIEGFEIYEENRVRDENKNEGFEIYEDNRVIDENQNKNEGFQIYVDEENKPQNENENENENENKNKNKNENFEIYVDQENRPKTEGFEIYIDEENRVRKEHKMEIGEKLNEKCKQISNENMKFVSHGVVKQNNISKGENAKIGNNRPSADTKDGLFEPTFFTKQALDDINEMFGKPLDF